MKKTQKQKIFEALEDAYYKNKDGWLSTRYLKQTLLISECNGRMSELKNEGYEIETSDFIDKYGFKFHRLKKSEPKQLELLK